MFNIVARKFRDLVHHLKHSRDDLFQEIRLFADDFFRDPVRKWQYTLQAVQKIRWYLIVLILFFQELNNQPLPLVPTASSEHKPQT